MEDDGRRAKTADTNFSELLRPKEVTAIRRVTVNHLAIERSRGEGPPICKLGGRVFYPADQLRDYISARIVDLTRRWDDGFICRHPPTLYGDRLSWGILRGLGAAVSGDPRKAAWELTRRKAWSRFTGLTNRMLESAAYRSLRSVHSVKVMACFRGMAEYPKERREQEGIR